MVANSQKRNAGQSSCPNVLHLRSLKNFEHVGLWKPFQRRQGRQVPLGQSAVSAKKVDVTWTTPESGLLLGISVKSISFRDTKTNNYQKNLTNRRGDMLFESTTPHRRFPY